jgi:hypothetical protein
MMALLFGMDALENLLFPSTAAADDRKTSADDIPKHVS